MNNLIFYLYFYSYFIKVMKSNNEVHAVCKDCLTRFDWAGKK